MNDQLEEERQRQYRMVDAWLEYKSLCRKSVSQDSHCILKSGHEEECRDNMGWTPSSLKQLFGP